VRFTVRGIMLVVACVALILGIFMACVERVRYPHINVKILNESSTTISDVRVSFLYGERTAAQLRSGGVAFTEIQSGGDAGIFVSYRDSTGTLRKAEPVYEESGTRGFLEIHVNDEGTWLVKRIYDGVDVGAWNIRVRATGHMAVK
jgi:hypothetical protein